MSRLRLALTDDDPAVHGPLDMIFETDPCYSATHMLYVFRGLVIQFQEKVYPKLPHKRGKQNKLLTKNGEIYGAQVVMITFYMEHGKRVIRRCVPNPLYS